VIRKVIEGTPPAMDVKLQIKKVGRHKEKSQLEAGGGAGSALFWWQRKGQGIPDRGREKKRERKHTSQFRTGKKTAKKGCSKGGRKDQLRTWDQSRRRRGILHETQKTGGRGCWRGHATTLMWPPTKETE